MTGASVNNLSVLPALRLLLLQLPNLFSFPRLLLYPLFFLLYFDLRSPPGLPSLSSSCHNSLWREIGEKVFACNLNNPAESYVSDHGEGKAEFELNQKTD